MIIFLISSSELKKEIKNSLQSQAVECKFINIRDKDSLNQFYKVEQEASALVTEDEHPILPQNAWMDILDSFGHRIPVLIVAKKGKPLVPQRYGRGELVSWFPYNNAGEILAALQRSGTLELPAQVHSQEPVPLFNPLLPMHMLQQYGSLSILSVHATDFRRVAIEYGSEAYFKLQFCFQKILHDIWRNSGCFQKRDILCRFSPNSNTYYILLMQDKKSYTLPPPGSLEKVADKVTTLLQSRLWSELFKPKEERMLPSYLHAIPKFSVGHATALHNPCVDSTEVVEALLETAKEVAKVQYQRTFDRKREFMQALILTDKLLVPHFQAVFQTKGLTVEKVIEAQRTKSIRGLASHIDAFEALIRVNASQISSIMDENGPIHLEARYLKPDMLFAMAGAAKLSLELDQACLKQATKQFQGLPGKLLVNILPRNFYYIDQLRHLLPIKTHVTFEVSESEAISNFGLLLKARARLPRENFAIAIDDFGKGYASLDRIIKIRPDVIKLDRSLVQDIHKDKPKKAFVSGLINAARSTNSLVLGEGVELIEEMEVLMKIGVDLLQGFLLHMPQSTQDIKEDLALEAWRKDLDTVA